MTQCLEKLLWMWRMSHINMTQALVEVVVLIYNNLLDYTKGRKALMKTSSKNMIGEQRELVDIQSKQLILGGNYRMSQNGHTIGNNRRGVGLLTRGSVTKMKFNILNFVLFLGCEAIVSASGIDFAQGRPKCSIYCTLGKRKLKHN
ncbi:hypothetical protein BDF14DRAFT_1765021 [Spinellus fusiger]|nr:hypothetical protein BDF14DRAFT_1765014 [Spinellus fusiger]KAI7871264.1 hypothetical protein BDF14DRAFT_1765021 [Spinellus fusiger]